MKHTLNSDIEFSINGCEIIDRIPDVLILTDQEGKIVLTNDVVEDFLGWKQHEILGLSIEMLIPPENRESHVNMRQNLFSDYNDRPLNSRINLLAWHKLGYEVPVDIKLSVTEINNKKYALAIIRDVTQQYNLQCDAEKKNKELQNLLDEKNNFLGIAAHDLRNPISSIQNFSQILLAHNIGPLTMDQEEFISRIHQSSEFMLNLLEDLLDFTTIESGTLNLRKTRFDILNLVDEVIVSNKIRARVKNISINFSQNLSHPLIIEADESKIHQVLNNLVDNAIKYSPENSDIEVICHLNKNQFSFNVIDSGIGIPEEDLPNLFQPFYRANNKPTKGEKSTGLGLFITKRIIDAHGGQLKVKSKSGIGSEFNVSFSI